jgi:hypothetical protein
MFLTFWNAFFKPVKPVAHKNACRILRAVGFESTEAVEYAFENENLGYLGAGAYGVVIDAGDYAIKYCRSNDMGYRAFLDIAMSYQSPYLPKILWTENVTDEIMAVAMEKLDDYYKSERSDEDDERLSNELDALCRLVEEDKLVPVNAELAEVAALLQATWIGYDNLDFWCLGEDLSGNNVMLRGNQLVVTDPWC